MTLLARKAAPWLLTQVEAALSSCHSSRHRDATLACSLWSTPALWGPGLFQERKTCVSTLLPAPLSQAAPTRWSPARTGSPGNGVSNRQKGATGPIGCHSKTPPPHPPAPSCQPIVHRGSKKLLLCLQFTPLFPLLTLPAINLAQQ